MAGDAFVVAKKAVTRSLGPVKRASELKIVDVDVALWQCRWHLEVCEPTLAYAWATVWMLRSAELVAVRWIHVSVNEQEKSISLQIPITKTDQIGWGVRRTLGCCVLRKCGWTCAWKVWMEISRRATSKSDFVFVEVCEGTKSTRLMAAAWKDKLKADLTGHSARRSGAMMYVRAGLPLQEVAFLGRWKSSIMLVYTEDALEEVPANQWLLPGVATAGAKNFASWKARRTPRPSGSELGCDIPVPLTLPSTFAAATTPSRAPVDVEEQDSATAVSSAGKRKVKDLWVYSIRDNRDNPTLHLLAAAGWDVPMSSWKTACN